MSLAGDELDRLVRLVRLLKTGEKTVDDVFSEAGPLVPSEHHEAVRSAYNQQKSTTIRVIEPGVMAEGGPRAWFNAYNPADGYYWRRQRDFLAHDLGRKEFEIDSLDTATNRILAHLENPLSAGPFNTRGLVIGHVQSGKTQNFSALIAKAADAGYKIVIVLSGLHNSLRRQTQQRLERDLGARNVWGVGEPEAGKRWQWMTSAENWGDFARGSFDAGMLQGTQQVILVVKKNKSRLEWLNDWMENSVPRDVSVLVIDDEADQASVNTGGNRPPEAAQENPVEDEFDLIGEGLDFDGDRPAPDEFSPSAINRNIRRLINHFHKCAYVAYTATPFANVLIDPEAFDREVGGDLYPRHFIITLPEPPGDKYVGAVRLFGRDAIATDTTSLEENGLDLIEFVSEADCELLIPPPGERASFVPSVPPSLQQALVDYVLAASALMKRSGPDAPCTMLIHTGMQKVLQNQLASDVVKALASIRQQFLYAGREYRPQLKARWDGRFRPVSASIDLDRDVAFEQIEPHIERLLRDGIEVRVLNSDHADELDYEREPSLKAVLLGGNKLSRGLTIDGLLVSYYLRRTLYYDTLLQMARWFGYRGDYVDLTRLYSTQELVSYFHDLATAEADLRNQVARYERERLTPTQFVVRVRRHAVMKVTQANKMQAAEENNFSYSGELVQSLRVAEALPSGRVRDPDRQRWTGNLQATRALFARLGTPDDPAALKPTWSGVDPAVVIEFLNAFVLTDERRFDSGSLIDYIQTQQRHQELTSWRVLLSCNMRLSEEEHWSEDLHVEGRARIPLIARTRKSQDPTSMGVVTDPGDEQTGLNEAQLAAAAETRLDFPGTTVAMSQRMQRDPSEGLLMIYPISPASQPTGNRTSRLPLFERPEEAGTIIQYAVSFPTSTSAGTVEYVSAPRPEGAA
ncbi:hypothetical protein QE364_000788 [Nocardioides zeae]|uniref:Uncharacterized protein n=1 Tax=Nocardioides zeae TaxID=1457234 RepID=A0ACC6IED6_9ACTN|nr:Z1 domain-containing protein [Nocardioides zeae]MDR6174291.1 hypothetical protein [Nocardioides zeae]MDR6209096.1 hypothetical protein [Nocardioides zeae]